MSGQDAYRTVLARGSEQFIINKSRFIGHAAPVSSAALKTDFLKKLNPASLEVCRGYAERFLGDAQVGDTFQFLRMGYFCKDPDATDALPVFNRVVGLKDSFAKQVKG